MKVTPVTLPPGRSSLAARPSRARSNRRCDGPHGTRRGGTAGNDERDRTADEIGRKHCQSIALDIGKAVIDREILRFHKTLLLQALGEAGRIGCVALGRGVVQESDHWQRPRLTDSAPRRQDGAAKKAGELSSSNTHASQYSLWHRMGWATGPDGSIHPTLAHRTNARP